MPTALRDARVLALLYTVGVLAVHALPRLPTFVDLLVISAPALWPWRGRTYCAPLVLGVLLSVLQAQQLLADRWPPQRHGEEVELRGHIASLPKQVAGEFGSIQRFEFRPEAPGAPRRIRVAWYRGEQTLKGGDCWILRLRMRSPRGSLNPGGFDYEGWLWREHLGATASVRSAEPCGAPARGFWLPLRQRLVDDIRHWLPGHPGVPLVSALTVGDVSALSDQDWNAFRNTATTHLIAISGFNVAIFATLAFVIVRWLWAAIPVLCLRLPAHKAGWVGAALLGLLYAQLAGWDAPVQRAALMLLALSAAAVMDRLGSPSRVLAGVWLLMLLWDPASIRSPGLWLSFGAVALIFYLGSARLSRPPAWREALSMQLALSLVLMPLTVAFFHGLAWLSAPVNLLAVPVVAVLTPLTLAAVVLAYVWPAVGVVFLGLCASAADQLRSGLVVLAEALPQSWLSVAPSGALLLLAGVGLVLLFVPRGLPMRGLGAVCLLPLLLPPTPQQRPALQVTVLDVGQGLAVVVQTPHHALVYDAGPAFAGGFDAGASVVAPYLLQRGLRSVDRLMISHDDRDHAGGAPALAQQVNIAAASGARSAQPCREGQRWRWDGVDFELLHPQGAGGSDNDNDQSCVLRIEGPFTVLIAGDISASAERQLLQRHCDRLPTDLLIVPHHGSRSSSGEAFVQAVAPRVAIFSAGWRNAYGHPAAAVVAQYRQAGARVYSTALSGALQVQLPREGRALQVQAWRAQAGRYWNAPAQSLR